MDSLQMQYRGIKTVPEYEAFIAKQEMKSLGIETVHEYNAFKTSEDYKTSKRNAESSAQLRGRYQDFKAKQDSDATPSRRTTASMVA